MIITGVGCTISSIPAMEFMTYVLVCGMINVTFFVVDSLVDWLKSLILKTVVFLFNCFFQSIYQYLLLLNNSDSYAVGGLLEM